MSRPDDPYGKFHPDDAPDPYAKADADPYSPQSGARQTGALPSSRRLLDEELAAAGMTRKPRAQLPRNPAAEQAAFQGAIQFAAQRMSQGASDGEVMRALVEGGLTAPAAADIVRQLRQSIPEGGIPAAGGGDDDDDGRKNMIYGALWCIGGTVVTVVTMQAASGGGTYVVCWGAILFGAIQFIQGLYSYSRG